MNILNCNKHDLIFHLSNYILVNMLCTFIDFGWCTKKLCQQCLHFNPGKFLGGHGRSFIEKSTTTTKKTIKSHLGTLFGASLYDCLDDIQGPLTWDQEMDGEEERVSSKKINSKKAWTKKWLFCSTFILIKVQKNYLALEAQRHEVLILTFVVIYLYLPMSYTFVVNQYIIYLASMFSKK